MQLTLVDASRTTPDHPAGPELPDRTLEVWLHLPDAPGPAPLQERHAADETHRA